MDMEIVDGSRGFPCFAYSNVDYAYLSLFDFVRISSNAPESWPSFLALRSVLTCSSVNG